VIQSVPVSAEMREAARLEAARRRAYIVQHFQVGHFGQADTDVLGFLGEFAARQFLNIPWRSGIREDYLVPDSYDLLVAGLRLDVKTESIPRERLEAVVRGIVPRDGLYASRWVNVGQASLLTKYDAVFFGAVARIPVDEVIEWFPLGWIPSHLVAEHSVVGRGATAAFAIPASDLNTPASLQALLDAKR